MAEYKFTDIPNPVIADPNYPYGQQVFDNLKSFKAGRGATSMGMDQQGFWVGADKFATAPFRVTMSGVVYIGGGSGFETTAGAQAKVDALANSLGDVAWVDLVEASKLGTTVIEGGYLKTSLINTGAIAITGLSGVGSLATKNSIDYTSSELTNKPTFGSLASKNTADWTSDIINKPTFGSLAFQSMVSDAMLDTTLIVGGYLKTSLINTGAIAISGLSGAGSLATKNSVDYSSSEVSNKPTLGSLASKSAVDYLADLINAPTLGSLASKSSVDYSSDVTNKPILGSLAYANAVSAAMCDTTLIVGGYIKTTLIQASAIAIGSLSGAGALASKNSVDYSSTEVTNKPTLGSLAAKSSVDYLTDLINPPTLGSLAAKNSVDYSSSEITNKPVLGSLAYANAVAAAMCDETLIVGGYIKTTLIQASAIAIGSLSGAGSLASKNSVDYSSSEVTNKPTLGSLASKSTADWVNDIINKPTLGSLASESMVSAALCDTTLIVNGYIKTGLVTADNIVAGALTGRTVQTDTSGARIELTSTYGLRSFDSSSKVRIRMPNDGQGIAFFDASENTTGKLLGITVSGGTLDGLKFINVDNNGTTGAGNFSVDGILANRTACYFNVDGSSLSKFYGKLAIPVGTNLY